MFESRYVYFLRNAVPRLLSAHSAGGLILKEMHCTQTKIVAIPDDNASEDDTATDAIDHAVRQDGKPRSSADAKRGRR